MLFVCVCISDPDQCIPNARQGPDRLDTDFVWTVPDARIQSAELKESMRFFFF